MAKECLICKVKVGFFAGQICLKDGSICESCWIKAGGSPAPQLVSETQKFSSAEIRQKIIENHYEIVDNSEFTTTKEIGVFLFDDIHKVFKIRGYFGKENLYQYNQIVSWELLENDVSITKGGLGNAVLGGILFGGIGAVTGGILGRKTSSVCETLKLKITLRQGETHMLLIPLLENRTKKTSHTYIQALETAHRIMSALELAIELQ